MAKTMEYPIKFQKSGIGTFFTAVFAPPHLFGPCNLHWYAPQAPNKNLKQAKLSGCVTKPKI